MSLDHLWSSKLDVPAESIPALPPTHSDRAESLPAAASLDRRAVAPSLASAAVISLAALA